MRLKRGNARFLRVTSTYHVARIHVGRLIDGSVVALYLAQIMRLLYIFIILLIFSFQYKSESNSNYYLPSDLATNR